MSHSGETLRFYSRARISPWQEMEDNPEQEKHTEKRNRKVLVMTPHRQSIHELNDTAAFLWKTLESPREISQILEKVRCEYDFSPMDVENLRKEIQKTLETMLDLGLLEAVAK